MKRSNQNFTPLFAALALALGALAMPSTARAQNSSFASQSWASGSSSRNGFIHGTMIIDYAFQLCSGTVTLFYSVRPGSARGYEGYWYDGVNYGVKSHWSPGTAPAMRAAWHVSFGATRVKEWQKTSAFVANNLTCGTGQQWMTIGPIAQFIGQGKTREEQREALNRFTFTVGQSADPMTSRAVEAEIQRDLRTAQSKARQDSLSRVSKARQDSSARVAKARADSVAQARQARQAREAAQRSAANGRGDAVANGQADNAGGMVAGEGRLRDGSSTRVENTGAGTAPRTTPLTRAEQQQLAREEAVRRQENARQQQVDRRLAQEAARERQAEAERQRRAESAAQVARMLEESRQREEERARQVDQAAEAVSGMVGQMMQARAETERRNEAIRERAAQRKDAYMASALAFHNASGPRPRCTASDARTPLQVGTVVNESITGTECRLADNTSATLFILTLEKKQKVELEIVQTGFFYPRLHLQGAGTNLHESRRIEATLNPGTYVVTVTTEGPGERGTFTLATRRGQLSKTSGLSLAFVGATAGLDMPGTATPDGDSQVEFRAGVGMGDYVTLLAQYVMPQSYVYGLTATEVGARAYLRRRHHAVRPWVQYLYGSRSVSIERPVTDEDYTGTGAAYGAGVEYFLAPQLGVEASLLMASGTVQRDGTGPEQSMSQTRLALGMTWHR
jgi:hypothetical protein